MRTTPALLAGLLLAALAGCGSGGGNTPPSRLRLVHLSDGAGPLSLRRDGVSIQRLAEAGPTLSTGQASQLLEVDSGPASYALIDAAGNVVLQLTPNLIAQQIYHLLLVGPMGGNAGEPEPRAVLIQPDSRVASDRAGVRITHAASTSAALEIELLDATAEDGAEPLLVTVLTYGETTATVDGIAGLLTFPPGRRILRVRVAGSDTVLVEHSLTLSAGSSTNLGLFGPLDALQVSRWND